MKMFRENTIAKWYEDKKFKDSFGNKFYLVVNDDLIEYRLKAKNTEYNKKLKKLQDLKINHVVVKQYLDVIDITKETEKYLNQLYPEYNHPQFQISE